ncbi:MAG: PAS domain S-box protein [Desulfobacterales bacterium]|nr:PAS domain S-box protein [Desulfobacterales bacterium]
MLKHDSLLTQHQMNFVTSQNNNTEEEVNLHKNAEKALQESEKRFRQLFNGSRDGVVIVNSQGMFIEANQAYCNMLGYTLEELKTMEDFYQITPEKWRQWEEDEIWKRRLLQNGYSGIYEKEYIRKDGTIFPVELQSYTVFDQEGKLSYLWGVVRDITERKRAEEEKDRLHAQLIQLQKMEAERAIVSLTSAVKESEEKVKLLSSVVTQSSEGMGVANLDGILLFINEAWIAMHGYEINEDFIGKPLSFFHSKEQLEKEVIPFNQKVIELGYAEGEMGHIRKDGTVFPTLMTVTLIKDDYGKPYAIAAVCNDITHTKRMENEKSELIKQLEKKNMELENSSLELKEATQQLIQAGKMTVLGELTAGIAHELNQPLNGIKIISQSLKYDIKKNRFVIEELDDKLKGIIDLVNRMAEIIQHMRIFTRQTSGEIYEKVDINTIISDAFNFVEQQMINNNIKVIKEFCLKPLYISANPIRIEQAMLNLFSNARYALINSNKENKELVVSIKEHANHVEVYVIDNGIGIPDSIKDKLFVPFFTTKEAGQGTGLGLSITSKIIEEHKGKIEFESNYNEYTSFKITLPMITY